MYLNTDPIHAAALPISPDASEGMAQSVKALSESYREHGHDDNGSPVDEAPAEKRRPTIAEIEAILNSEEDVAIEILPNGEIRAKGSGEAIKPVTMRENLGGEYGDSLSNDLIEAARDARGG